MPDDTISPSESLATGTRVVQVGVVVIVLILGAAVYWLFSYLPDANAFNDRIEQIFVENDALTSPDAIRLLEVLAQSGTTFSKVLASYRAFIFVLLIAAAALLAACLGFIVALIAQNRRMREIERKGLQVSSLILAREERMVVLNDMEFKLTDAAMETLSVLAEARMDDDVLTGAEIEAMVSGRMAADCDEAAGATRIKRLRDTLGNQMVSELLIRNIARKGYVLAIDKDVIRMN